jgi:hypothetical protein
MEEIKEMADTKEEESSEEGDLASAIGEEKKEEGGIDWEERYKNLQSAKDREVQKYKDLLTPFESYIQRDPDGNMRFKDFSSPQYEEIPPEPSETEWLEDPKTAYMKQRTHDKFIDRIEENERWKAYDVEESYKKARAEAWSRAMSSYPELKNPDSSLFKRADEILKEDPALVASPYCDLTAVKLAAIELGISSQESSKKLKKETSYIISGDSGQGRKSTKELSDDEFIKLSPTERDNYMRKQYSKGG